MCWKEENYKLSVENEILRDENRRVKIAHCTAVCLTCCNSSVQNQLAVEMERLMGQSEWLQQEVHHLLICSPIKLQLLGMLNFQFSILNGFVRAATIHVKLCSQYDSFICTI